MLAAVATVLVIGGGLVGSIHALEALHRGHQVTLLARTGSDRSRTAGGFGSITVSGQPRGRQLTMATQSLQRWKLLSDEAPSIGPATAGSLIVAVTEMDWEAMTAAIGMNDAKRRGLTLLPAESLRARGINGPDVRGALWCRLDATLDPVRATAALHARLLTLGATIHHDREVIAIDDGAIKSRARGGATRTDRADLVIVCPDTATNGPGLVAGRPDDRRADVATVRVQGFLTEPAPRMSDMTITDSDTLRSQPGFRRIAAQLGPREPEAREFSARLRMTQLDDGRVMVGEALVPSLSGEPGLVGAMRHLLRRAEEILGATLPPIEHQCTWEHSDDDGTPYIVREATPRTWTVSEVTELGIACLPALARQLIGDALGDSAPDRSTRDATIRDAKSTGPRGERDRSTSFFVMDGNHGGAVPVGEGAIS